jgi:CRISPR-associated endonuclease/helicase Cas3
MHSSYAHTRQSSTGNFLPQSEWEPLFTADCETLYGGLCKKCATLEPQHGHLNKVASLAGKFAEDMFPPESGNAHTAAEWTRLIGWWHDLGKFAPEWQDYLKIKTDSHADEIAGKADHSTAGAQHAEAKVDIFGKLLAYIIAGHHAGLADGISDSNGSLENRLKKRIPNCQLAPEQILTLAKELPPLVFSLRSGHSMGFLIRMLFSCLVDADFLATEAFMSPEVAGQRGFLQPDIPAMEDALRSHLLRIQEGAPHTTVNRFRSEVLQSCFAAANQKPGLFSLTVPTGGGKTLSSMAFALKHARSHNLRRVIYVIPFTSIIEQNAAVFREALASLGPEVVLEHHSNLDPELADENTVNRLASENWDARLIVTTNVQFFESLHANRTSRCRKLHRIARSVIILDEAQSLPVDLLDPCLRTLEELTRNYGASVVLCTATQPAVSRREEFPIGLENPREIIPDPVQLYQGLRRVTAHKPSCKISDAQLAEQLTQNKQVLCIVNTRRHARELFEFLPDDGSRFHLSALMCPQHRTEILNTIRQRLKAGEPVRLISTQLIEAGVDIDFPVVFRALAGLDSIAQAAGRCDREGRLTQQVGGPAGKLIIFEPEAVNPPGFIRSTADSAAEVLASDQSDPLALECIEQYFRIHYWKHGDETDQHHIRDCYPRRFTCENDLLCFQFKKCAEAFKLIDDYTDPVIVPHGNKGRSLCDGLSHAFDPGEQRRFARKLQRFTVSIPKQQHAALLLRGILKPLHEDCYFVLNSDAHYNHQFGLHPHPDLTLTAENSII